MLHTVATTLALACIGPRSPRAFRRDRFAGAHAGYEQVHEAWPSLYSGEASESAAA